MNTIQNTRLSNVARINPRCSPVAGDTEVSFVAMSDVTISGKMNAGSIRSFKEVASGYTQFEEGDVLVAKITPCFENGKGALATKLQNGRGAGSTEFHVLRPTKSIDGRFLNLLCSSSHFRRTGEACMEGSAGQKRVPVGFIKNYRIFCPNLPEQRKIADILSTWDEALEKLDALIEAQERRKKALMQQLLTGKKRIPGFKGQWKRVSLGKALEPITRAVAKPEGSFLAAGIRSHGKGVFLKPDFKPADITLEELFELKAGDLVVNITFAWEGAAAIVPPDADGALVSHRFPTFGFRKGQAATSFFRHYIRTKRFIFDCGLASPGGAGRNRVLSKSAFLNIELLLPPFEEQEKIGAILDTADQQLTLLRTQRSALGQQKHGLMQRLLTGKLRVKP